MFKNAMRIGRFLAFAFMLSAAIGAPLAALNTAGNIATSVASAGGAAVADYLAAYEA